MTAAVSEVHLFNLERGEPEAAELWDAITERQLADWEGEWMPELFMAIQRLNRAGGRASTLAAEPSLELAQKG